MSYQPQQAEWRTLNMDFRSAGGGSKWMVTPAILIDGVRVIAVWGRQSFWIPTNRQVHIQCYVEGLFRTGDAELVVGPGGDVFLEYTCPATNFTAGSLGPPGTTKARGWPVIIAVATIPLLMLIAIFALI